jgi:hypothetical protein
MVVGFGAREGGLAIVFFSRRPDASLVSDPARAGEVGGTALGPSGDLAPVPEVGVGTGEEGKGDSPDPGSDEDGGVDTKGIPAETVKKEKEKSANYLPKKKKREGREKGGRVSYQAEARRSADTSPASPPHRDPEEGNSGLSSPSP